LVKQTSVTANEKASDSDNETEAITPKSILRRFELYNDYVSKIRQQNTEANLDVKRNNDFVPQTKLLKQEVYEKFIKQATARNGKWNTVISLQDQGILSDLDVEQFEGKEYPYARLNRLTRVKNQDGKEYLERMFTLYALTRDGNVIHKVITDIDYYHRPTVVRESVLEDIDDREGKQIHVTIMPSGGVGWGNEPKGHKVNLIEYSEKKVREILETIPPNGAFTDLYNGCALTMTKIGETQDSMVVKNLNEFLEDFDVVWKRYRDLKQTGSIDVKELVSELQKQTVSAASQAEAYQ
jgi:hypothetical protein